MAVHHSSSKTSTWGPQQAIQWVVSKSRSKCDLGLLSLLLAVQSRYFVLQLKTWGSPLSNWQPRLRFHRELFNVNEPQGVTVPTLTNSQCFGAARETLPSPMNMHTFIKNTFLSMNSCMWTRKIFLFLLPLHHQRRNEGLCRSDFRTFLISSLSDFILR